MDVLEDEEGTTTTREKRLTKDEVDTRELLQGLQPDTSPDTKRKTRRSRAEEEIHVADRGKGALVVNVRSDVGEFLRHVVRIDGKAEQASNGLTCSLVVTLRTRVSARYSVHEVRTQLTRTSNQRGLSGRRAIPPARIPAQTNWILMYIVVSHEYIVTVRNGRTRWESGSRHHC